MKRDDSVFFKYVGDYCSDYPDVIPYLVEVLTDSIKIRLEKEYSVRKDIEVALIASLSKKSKSINSILLDKLEKIQPLAFINFQSIIDELKEDIKK